MTIAQLVAEAGPSLTPAERRVADSVLADPQAVAFGTVASLAEASTTSGPTVVRFAAKLGFAGFADLQAEAQGEIADALRPATARIRERPPSDVVAQVEAAAIENVRATFENASAEAFRAAVALLSDPKRRVFVLAGEIARGVGIAFVTQLDLLRPGVVSLGGSTVRVARQLAELRPGDVVVAIEHRRYERWLLDALDRAREGGAEVVALTDSTLSPVAVDASATFTVAARGVGPFDSHVGTLVLLDALAAGVAAKLQKTATARLDAIEVAWTDELVNESHRSSRTGTSV
jgi:DNA-binding MurR/RpiR family transcriptional regulator